MKSSFINIRTLLQIVFLVLNIGMVTLITYGLYWQAWNSNELLAKSVNKTLQQQEQLQVREEDFAIMILTGRPHQRKRIPAMLNTWLNNTKAQIYIFSETGTEDIPRIKVLPGIPDSYEANTPKFWDGMSRVWQHVGRKAKWFIKVDDDTYLNTKTLASYLNRHAYGLWKNVSALGRSDSYTSPYGERFSFIDGGAGQILSQTLVRSLYDRNFMHTEVIKAFQHQKIYKANDLSLADVLFRAFPDQKVVHQIASNIMQHDCAPEGSEAHDCLQLQCISLHYCDEKLMRFWMDYYQ